MRLIADESLLYFLDNSDNETPFLYDILIYTISSLDNFLLKVILPPDNFLVLPDATKCI